MNKYPIVSIVTPSFNQGAFIDETIESVLSQEGDFYLDYIVMDGGSADNSVAIIEKYAHLIREKKYPVKCRGIEYRWISAPDNGQSDAVNKGFLMSKGEILSFLNSDDLYTPGAIMNVVRQFLENPGVKLVYGDGFGIDEFNQGRSLSICRGKFKLKTLKRGDTVCQPSVFVKREIIDTVGPLDASLHFSMDFEWFIRIANKYKASYIPVSLSCSRRHEGSKAADKYLLDLRGAHLSIVRKYGGRKNFARALGFDILRLINRKGITHVEAFNILKQAIIKKNRLIDSPIRDKEFLDGYAYFFIQDSLAFASSDKRRALKDAIFVIRNAPFLILTGEFILINIKLLLPEKLYLCLRYFIRRCPIPISI